jgi:hypothetical protein
VKTSEVEEKVKKIELEWNVEKEKFTKQRDEAKEQCSLLQEAIKNAKIAK